MTLEACRELVCCCKGSHVVQRYGKIRHFVVVLSYFLWDCGALGAEVLRLVEADCSRVAAGALPRASRPTVLLPRGRQHRDRRETHPRQRHAARSSRHATDLYINNLDTGLASLSIANGDSLKLTSPAQHALRG